MKSSLQSVFVILLLTFSSFASATDMGTRLLLSMELKEGETIVSKPKLIVLNGKRASVEVGSAGTNPFSQMGWKIEVMPMLANADDLITNFNIKVSALGADGISQTRSMSVETKQSLGKEVLIQLPGADGQQPLSLSLKTDLATP